MQTEKKAKPFTQMATVVDLQKAETTSTLPKTERELINKEIAKLNYDPQTVMVFDGTKIKNVDPPSEEFDGNTYTVVTREKCSYEGEFDIAVPAAYNSITYPGALLVASNELLDGKPQELPAERAETTITIDLPGARRSSFKTVPTYDNVTRELNEILREWLRDNKSIAANFQYTSSLIYDENELALKFGCDINFLKQKIGIDFKNRTSEQKSMYIVQFKQIFYTVSAERTSKPGDTFSENTTWNELARAGISDKHPPLFVKSVQYGRQIFLKFESSLSSTELETTLKATISKNGFRADIEMSAENKSKLGKINVSVIALGGSPDLLKDLDLSVPANFGKINNVIFKDNSFSEKSPAAPLNYFCVFLKDGVSAGLFGTTEYIKEKTQSFVGGDLTLSHKGAYVGRFYVSWDEVKYVNGSKSTKRVSWDGNGKDRTASFKTVIPFKGNVRNIEIKSQGCTGLAWEWWRTSGHKANLSLVPHRSVAISGTTLDQRFQMEPSE